MKETIGEPMSETIPGIPDAELHDNSAASTETTAPVLHEGPKTAVAFEIRVFATTNWPASCDGVKDVIRGVQVLLTAASEGQQAAFMKGWNYLDAAVRSWKEELW